MKLYKYQILITAILMAALYIGCSDFDKVKFDCCPMENNQQKAICFESDTIWAKANGADQVVITACVPGKTVDEISNIEFTCNALAGSFENNQQSVTSSLSSDKSARAFLTTGGVPGVYTVTAKVMLDNETIESSCVLWLERASKSGIEFILKDTMPLRADNTTILLGSVQVDRKVDATSAVTISKSNAISFLQDETVSEIQQVPDASGKVSFVLKVGHEYGPALLSAEYNGNSEDYILDILPAYPDTIVVTTTTNVISALGDSVGMDVYVKRLIGEVSEDIDILVQAYQLIGNERRSVGIFDPPFLTSVLTGGNAPNATTTLRISPSDSLELMPVIIEVISLNDNGEQVKATKSLVVD